MTSADDLRPCTCGGHGPNHAPSCRYLVRYALEPCPYEWWAPRADVPDSVPVRHVCKNGLTDHVLHACPCGRNTLA